jgi:ferredoxin-NADP reductase
MRQTLDRVLGRVTMYRLVTLSLVVIAAVALALSALGRLPFTPAAVAGSAAIAVASTVLSNRVLAMLLRTRPHTESSVITGLLLFLLFWPSLVSIDLLTLALAGVLATVSKYLVAWRGRHVFNPVALGATLVAVLQLTPATWWVASSDLLPVVLVTALLVLYRTRRLPLAGVFAVIAAGILTVRLTLGGQGVADALTTAVTAYPIVFFVGFMLSEPLTLPPRRWQQLALAAIVGVLFTVPFTFGPVYLSFEFALLVGNLLAFLVGQRRGLHLRLLGKRRLTPTAWEFSFQPDHPIAFRPGQYLELTVPHSGQDGRGSRRTFSVSSAPSPTAPVTVGLRMPDRSSSYKRALLELEPGALLSATSVGGDFLLPRDVTTPLLLVAGGIGITPFLSQLAHDRAEGHERDAVIVYAVSSAAELAYRDELAEETVLLVCPEPPEDLPAAWRWVGAGPVTGALLKETVPDLASRSAFVSGAPRIVNDVRVALRRLGVRRVTTDYFSGY